MDRAAHSVNHMFSLCYVYLFLKGGTLVLIALGHCLPLLYKNTELAIKLETKYLTDESVEKQCSAHSDHST